MKNILGVVVGILAGALVMQVIEGVGLFIAPMLFPSGVTSKLAFTLVAAVISIVSLAIGVYAGARIYKMITKTSHSNKSLKETE